MASEEEAPLPLRVEDDEWLNALQGLCCRAFGCGDAMIWEKKPALASGGLQSNCFNGGPQPIQLPLEAEIAVGFGSCSVMKDETCLYQQDPGANEDAPRLQKFEDLAKADPDHDWQVHFLGAMSEETYQRHGDGLWVLIEKEMGFA